MINISHCEGTTINIHQGEATTPPSSPPAVDTTETAGVPDLPTHDVAIAAADNVIPTSGYVSPLPLPSYQGRIIKDDAIAMNTSYSPAYAKMVVMASVQWMLLPARRSDTKQNGWI